MTGFTVFGASWTNGTLGRQDEELVEHVLEHLLALQSMKKMVKELLSIGVSEG